MAYATSLRQSERNTRKSRRATEMKSQYECSKCGFTIAFGCAEAFMAHVETHKGA